MYQSTDGSQEVGVLGDPSLVTPVPELFKGVSDKLS